MAGDRRGLFGAVTTDLALVFETERTGEPDRSDCHPLATHALRIALYGGILTVFAVHALLVVLAYRVAAVGHPLDAAVRSLLRLDRVALPATVPDGTTFVTCLLAAVLVHELGHVVTHRLHGVRVHAVGTELLLLVPFRFYTSHDREDWDCLSPRAQATVQSAGIATNLVVAAVAFALFSLTGSRLTAWLYGMNVAVALLSAVPVSGTDGNPLLSYLLTGTPARNGVETRNRLALVTGVGSWLVVVGAVLVVVVATVVK